MSIIDVPDSKDMKIIFEILLVIILSFIAGFFIFFEYRAWMCKKGKHEWAFGADWRTSRHCLDCPAIKNN